MTAAADDSRKLGQGRSGMVFRAQDRAGRQVAQKIFICDRLSKLVHYVFSGAPNPYVWSASAIRSAVLRRQIVDALLPLWFGSKLRVARPSQHGWNQHYRAFEMCCELINGRHVALQQPFTPAGGGQLRDAVHNIMKPLQSHLMEAGFDGLVWQAGLGNPVALNNFMCEGQLGNGSYRWAWIDLESGVPALAPINPMDLLRFYLPKSVAHGAPLFDDVDIPKLQGYVAAHRQALLDGSGAQRLRQLEEEIQELAGSQHLWRSLPRHRRSIAYRLAKGGISPQLADWYARRPLPWYFREAVHGSCSAVRACARLGHRLLQRIAGIRLGPLLRTCWLLVWSQEYRAQTAQKLIGGRITRWERRGQLTDAQAGQLRAHLEAEEVGSYLTDFGMHLAIKPAVKILQYWLMPALLAMGLVSGVFFAAVLVFGGPVSRFLYTLGRLIQNALHGRERPWLALLWGLAPVVGNLAFPVQILFSSTRADSTLAQFILYDAFSRFGQMVPIWGGPDTLTEHVFNRLPNCLLRFRRSSAPPAQPPIA